MINVSLHKPTEANAREYDGFVAINLTDDRGSSVTVFLDDRASGLLLLATAENAMKLLGDGEQA